MVVITAVMIMATEYQIKLFKSVGCESFITLHSSIHCETSNLEMTHTDFCAGVFHSLHTVIKIISTYPWHETNFSAMNIETNCLIDDLNVLVFL